MSNTNNKNKSFFQRLTDTFISILPLNSSFKKDEKLLPKDISFPMNKSTRFASEIHSELDNNCVRKSKRQKLCHDPMSFSSTRILKVSTPISLQKQTINQFNDAASDISDHSNVSVSTSGVSSLHPRTNKRFNLNFLQPSSGDVTMKNADNANIFLKSDSYQNGKQSLFLCDRFISSNARKILDNLDRITTPVTAGDKLFSLPPKSAQKCNEQSIKYQPYSRNNPGSMTRNLVPTKAVTVSASSSLSQYGPLRRKQTTKYYKKLGYYEEDNVDLDDCKVFDSVPSLVESSKLNFSHMPLLTISRSTNTEGVCLVNDESPVMHFDFGPPSTIHDKGYVTNDSDIDSPNTSSSNKYVFKSVIKAVEKVDKDQSKNNVAGLWRCNTCFTENRINTIVCRGCSTLSSSNTDKIVFTKIDKNINSINHQIDGSTLNDDMRSFVQSSLPVSSESQSSSLLLPQPAILSPSDVPSSFPLRMPATTLPAYPSTFHMTLPGPSTLSSVAPPSITSISFEISTTIPPISVISPPPTLIGIPFSVPPPSFGVPPPSFGVPPPDMVSSVKLSTLPLNFGMPASVSVANHDALENLSSSTKVPVLNFSSTVSPFSTGSVISPSMFTVPPPSSTFTFGLTPHASQNLATSVSNPNFKFDPTVAPPIIPSYNLAQSSNFKFGSSVAPVSQDNNGVFTFGSNNPFNASTSVPGNMDRMAAGACGSSSNTSQRKIIRSRRKK